jgi:hypothetical protein
VEKTYRERCRIQSDEALVCRRHGTLVLKPYNQTDDKNIEDATNTAVLYREHLHDLSMAGRHDGEHFQRKVTELSAGQALVVVPKSIEEVV